MRIPRISLLAVFLAVPLHAQQPGVPAASPLPLPPPPYVKSPPDTAQWLITYSQGSPGAKTPPNTASKNKAPEFAKKTVVVTKNPGIVSETTARQNGAVTRKFRTPTLAVTQLGNGEWILSGGQNSFNETDYAASPFAGFGWLAQSNYVGVQDVASRRCYVFHDKVVTADPEEIQLIRASMQAATDEWTVSTYEARKKKSATPAPKSGQQQPPSQAGGIPPPPAAFDANSYKRDVTAYIDVDTGLPVMLDYETTNHLPETRVYTFMPAPATPLALPPEAQKFFDNRQANLKRLSAPAAVP